MDIVRVLSAADLEVRRKTLTLVMDLVSSRNIDEVSCIVCVGVSLSPLVCVGGTSAQERGR